MSDAVVGEFVTAPARPRLRLVGPDERGRAPARPATRLTGRGWRVITLVTAAAMVTLAVVLATSVDAAAPQIDHATTVSAGQTLSDVAATQLPSLSINDAVARIQLVNGLNTSQVHAGQSLLIPAMP
jgi:LysM domain